MTQLKVRQPLDLEGMIHRKRNFMLLLTFLVMAALLSIVIAVCVGTVKIAPEEAYRILLYNMFQVNIGDVANTVPAGHMDIIWQLRLPRVLMALIVGAGLAMCGTVMQATVQNPLAEPYILGIAAGASLGATFSILIGGAGGIFLGMGTAFWAFLGALLATVLVMLLSGLGGQLSTVKMVLSGAVISALFGAVSNFIIYLSSDAEGMRTVTFWTMGSLAAAKWDNLLIPALGVGLCCVFFLLQARRLNALLLGEEAAITLGIDLLKIRRLYMVLTALITGIIVSACGVFGFVGLVIPHVVRGLVGSDHRRLMPGTILVGAAFLVWADVLARSILKSGDLPIGIITALIGAPFFIHLLFKRSLNFGSN